MNNHFKLLNELANILIENYKLAFQEFSRQSSEEEVRDILDTFKRRQARIAAPEKKDINYWRKQGYDAFKEFVEKIDTRHDSKRERARRVQAASKDILTLKKNDEVHLFIPVSKEASCFYGVGGGDGEAGWCISTRDGSNYFYDYTIVNEQVIFFLLHEQEVYALVIDPITGAVRECQDKTNNGLFSVDKFLQIAGVSIQDLQGFYKKNREKIEASFKTGLAHSATTDPDDALRFAIVAMRKREKISDEIENVIARNKYTAYKYATEVLGARFRKGEPAIASDPFFAVNYAAKILKGRFHEAENSIAKSPVASWRYAYYTLNGPFPEGESAIASTTNIAYKYAFRILNGRFPQGETEIAKDAEKAFQYALHILEGPFPEAEPVIAKDTFNAFRYAHHILEGPFPEGEEAIAKDAQVAVAYASELKKARLPQAEYKIYRDRQFRERYAKTVPGGKEAMEKIARENPNT